jgi:hypothetical protein
VTALLLPAVYGGHAHGWLAAVGAARVLADRWPGLCLRWDQQWGVPVFTGGPATAAEAAEAILADTVGQVPPGAVLPGGGRSGVVRLWERILLSPAGRPHPMLAPHAAQTIRTMLMKPADALRADPGLMVAALTGLGLHGRYPAGLWLLHHRVDAAASGDGRPRSRASAGRDWLAIMALQWMPPDDTDGGLTDEPWRVAAPCWRWELAGPGRPRVVARWRLWPDPVPAVDIPGILGREPGGPRFAAHRPPPSALDRFRPPYLLPLGRSAPAGA